MYWVKIKYAIKVNSTFLNFLNVAIRKFKTICIYVIGQYCSKLPQTSADNCWVTPGDVT